MSVSPLGMGEPEKPVKALIIDRRAVLGTDVCRSIGRMGWRVDIFGEHGSPVFSSRYCSQRILAPSWADGPSAYVSKLREVVENQNYDAIFVCNEEVLKLVAPLRNLPGWGALPLPDPCTLQILASKHETLKFAAANGITIPQTIFPRRREEIESAAASLGFPMVVKGDGGQASEQVRIVWQPEQLEAAFDAVTDCCGKGARLAALQQYIEGIQYSIGGLFDEGTPLRICAYHKLYTYPEHGGLTARAVTERPPRLMDSALSMFKALKYTGLGQMQFIRDAHDGNFKLLEVNPRVWGCIGLLQHAGVDLYAPYLALAQGQPVKPDLNFREGVIYRRITVDARVVVERPLRAPGFILDCLNPKVSSDFQWTDPGPHIAALRSIRRLVSHA